jgi:hypothetical protein
MRSRETEKANRVFYPARGAWPRRRNTEIVEANPYDV